jgi:hypothetical protein
VGKRFGCKGPKEPELGRQGVGSEDNQANTKTDKKLEIANCLKQARTQETTDLAQPSGFAQILVQ